MYLSNSISPSIPKPPRGFDTRVVNPYFAIRDLTWSQQALFWSGWFAWLSDAYDFFCVSLTILRLQEQFGQTTHALTTAITLTLLFRPVGAVLFGLIADRFGRKWPLVSVLLIISILQIATGFVDTFPSFLAVRSLFGIAMGGVWGLASAASMESMPPGSRGVYSGLMQCGYPGGYLVASVVNLYLVPRTPQTWRTIFWVGAGLSAAAAFVRSLLPESDVFSRSQEVTRRSGLTVAKETKLFFKSLRLMFKQHWALWIFGIVLLSALNFLAHGSQDLYTTFMQNSKGFDASHSTTANIIGETGAVAGAFAGGFISQFLGRRLTLLFASVWCCCFIPLYESPVRAANGIERTFRWIVPKSWSLLSLGAFFFQFGVNTAWGTVAIYLNELAPPAFRGLYPGTVYQLGNAASAAAAQIEATAGLTIRAVVDGQEQPDYGKVQALVAAASCALIMLSVFFGPERHSVNFENENTAIEEVAPSEVKAAMTMDRPTSGSEIESTHSEKINFQYIE